jgi:hypothetical protein
MKFSNELPPRRPCTKRDNYDLHIRHSDDCDHTQVERIIDSIQHYVVRLTLTDNTLMDVAVSGFDYRPSIQGALTGWCIEGRLVDEDGVEHGDAYVPIEHVVEICIY